jgi:psp operon transcriptional activator
MVKGAGPMKIQEALGQSEAFLDFQERLSLVAPIDRPVILIGERGTGKELAAIKLHFLSRRWKGPFVALNCSALSSGLIESELFGYEKGAFTGAESRRKGRFEAADGGTLFLDEIGTIPLEVQEKILRVVEYGSFERVGSPERLEVEVRIIAATNADLAALARDGRFKSDLLDRLSFETLFLPPLRERDGDIEFLARHFAERISFELGREGLPLFSDEAMRELKEYKWPGNIRELKNVIERSVYRSEGSLVEKILFGPFSPSGPRHSGTDNSPSHKGKEDIEEDIKEGLFSMPLKEALATVEKEMLKRALSQTRFNQKKAAERLGLTYNQFRGIYRKFNGKLD